MLRAALSASRRGFLLLAVVLTALLSLGLAGCAGVVSGNGGENNPPPTPLVITNVQISAGITQATPVASGANTSSVWAIWVTNIPATSEIEYGTTAAYGASTPVGGSMVTNHHMAHTNLSRAVRHDVLLLGDGGGFWRGREHEFQPSQCGDPVVRKTEVGSTSRFLRLLSGPQGLPS